MFRSHARPSLAVATAGLLVLADVAAADPTDTRKSFACPVSTDVDADVQSGGDLSLENVLDAVRRASPATRVAALEAIAALHDADQAARLPNPELTLETENFAGSAPFGGFRQSELTFTLSQTIRFGDKRRLEHRAAEARAAVAAADHRVVLRASELEAARRFYELGAAAAAAGSWAKILVLSNDFAAAVSRRVDAGKLAPTELARSRAAAAIVRAAAAEAGARAEAARYALSALWGDNAPAFSTVRADLESRVSIPEPDDLAAAVADHPRLLVAQAGEAARTAELGVARSRAYPDLTVGLGVRRFEAAGDALVASVNLPLPVFNRNRDAAQAVAARIDGAAANRHLARVELVAALQDATARARGAELRRAALLEEALPAAIEAERATRVGYDAGKFNLTTVLDARRDLIDTRLRGIDAGLAARLAEVDVRALTNAAPFDGTTCPGDAP